MGAKLVKKLSIKTAFGDKSKIRAAAEEFKEVKICRIVGIVKGFETGSGDNGDYVAFKGDFKATNLITNETSRSATCFLPDVASGCIESAVLSQVRDEDRKEIKRLDKSTGELEVTGYKGDCGNPVEFGFDIGVIENADSIVGYEYFAAPLIEAGESDPLAHLEVTHGIQALESPHAAKAEKQPEKQPEKATPKADTPKAEDKKVKTS